MSYDYSENVLVQDSAGNLLQNELGWEVAYAYNTEKLGKTGTFGRKNYREIVLWRYFRQAVMKLNPWLTEALYQDAVKKLEYHLASSSLIQINEEKYGYLRDGIPISVKKPDGKPEIRRVRVFDFDDPLNNHFLAIKELKIHGELYRRRTDIVGFVNGIPLLFVELKNFNVDVQDAYTCNYSDYLDTVPHLFYYNAFLILSNGEEAKVGTLGSKYAFFHEWKRLKEDEEGSVALETMLRGICNKRNLMDLFENFILFDHSGGHTAKILARNHQYLGVNEAVEVYKQRKLRDGKLGVFWHTQGSGKSYSMLFLAQKIRRKFDGSPTFVVLTDRDELNTQISDTFENCGMLGNVKASKYKGRAHAFCVKKTRQVRRRTVDFFASMWYILFRTNGLSKRGDEVANYTEEQWYARKVELMEKCYDCFAEHGLHGTGIRVLASECGFNHTKLYTYFKDLDDLIIQSTEYCMTKVEADFMAKAPVNVPDIWRFIDEIPYWTAEKHGKKYRLMYQVYTHPKYRQYGQKFFSGVDQRYTEYAKLLEGKLGIPYQKLTPLIFILIRACVHYALFEDEFYLKSQIEVLKESLELFIMKYNPQARAGTLTE